MAVDYVELHARSFYAFGEGASHPHELLAQAQAHGCPALALTDPNLCGALEFARLATSSGVQPITGGELPLPDGARLVLLAKTREGYANLTRLFTLANAADRRAPRLDPARLPDHAAGLILLTGGRDGPLAQLAEAGRYGEARALLSCYRAWFGPEAVYVELQHTLRQGDGARTRALAALARETGMPLVATNDVRYHAPERARLQQALAAARRNTTLDRALPFLHPNDHCWLKPPAAMAHLFRDYPEAIANTVRIAAQCRFNLHTDLGYTLPAPRVPAGQTPAGYLRRLCEEAARRRDGGITEPVRERLDEEFRLIERHGLAGFLLLYREIVRLARGILAERGLVPPDTPLEERPPGRGRGSSVALLVGYLIGVSHVDPLHWNLTLERFLPEDMTTLPDIDLDFPRALRDALIVRVHEHFGPDAAVLAGAVATYALKGAIQDLGKALGLPPAELRSLAKQIDARSGADLREQMRALPAFRDRVEAPGWRELTQLAPPLIGAPRRLGQHVGGMVLSDRPLSGMVPIRAGAIAGRYIMDWDKDSVADAGFAKIDLLALPVLDQIAEALDWIEEREGVRPDLSRIDPADPQVYDLINAGRAKGVFLLQSPAQLQIARRLRARTLQDLAYQVALIRPGVGVQGGAVSQFIARHRDGAAWTTDHPLEARALARTSGVIVWQEQVVQLIMDVAGMSAAEADTLRRAFARPQSEQFIALQRQRFLAGARQRGVPEDVAGTIFAKITGHYMFPESHSHAFAVTAYQAAWLKRYYPLEFFVALVNQQPMGFYPLETLKEDARRFGVPFRTPCLNRSRAGAIPADGGVRLGLRRVKAVGRAWAERIVRERERHGPYRGTGDLVRRAGVPPQAARSLVEAGAFDAIIPNRRTALWEAEGAIPPARGGQRALAVATEVPALADWSASEKMRGEYRALGLYPRGHLMAFVRPTLPAGVRPAAAVAEAADGTMLRVAGWPIARQHPRGEAGTVFVTIEDESGDVQCVLWPRVFARSRRALRGRVLLVTGTVTRWDGTTTLAVVQVESVPTNVAMPQAHDWH